MATFLHRAFSAERDRWVLWLPVALGVGISVYFLIPFEPSPWSGVACLVATLALGWRFRRSSTFFIALLSLSVLASGFCAAQLRASLVAAPMLARKHGPAQVSGLVVESAARQKGGRIVLRYPVIEGLAAHNTPLKVRLRLTRNEPLAPRVGSHVRVRAILRPPPAPAAPGAFDFGRQAYFARLGAVGFAVGRLEAEALPESAGASGIGPLTWGLWWTELRQKVGQRILAVLPGGRGGIALALMTGDRSAIPETITQDMRDSGLAHLLAISGLHMGLLVGFLFFLVRAVLALFPALVLRFPIKKWAAVVSAVGGLAYLYMAGASVPTQRAFIMVCIVLLAVLIDRSAISLRLVAWAASAVLVIAPESLLSASFQMSFAAVTALVAAYETAGRPLSSARLARGHSSRMAFYLAGVAMSSVIAIAATAPFAVYHFNRLASFGLVANMAAVPLTAFWIMPWALLAFLLMPLGLESLALVPMGLGTAGLIELAGGIAAWPGSVLLVKAMPMTSLATIVLGGLWLCLWQRTWRIAGLPVIAIGLVLLLLSRPPDVLISADGRLMALRDGQGHLWLSSRKRAGFVAETWLRRNGASSGPVWPLARRHPQSPLDCDSLGCVYKGKGHVTAFAMRGEALAEDCRRATILVSLEPLRWRRCQNPDTVIDRFDLWRRGAHAVWLDAGRPVVQSVAQGRTSRPWGGGMPAGDN